MATRRGGQGRGSVNTHMGGLSVPWAVLGSFCMWQKGWPGTAQSPGPAWEGQWRGSQACPCLPRSAGVRQWGPWLRDTDGGGGVRGELSSRGPIRTWVRKDEGSQSQRWWEEQMHERSVVRDKEESGTFVSFLLLLRRK